MQRVLGINETAIKKTLHDGEIQSVSIASGKKNNIASTKITNTESKDAKQENENNIYGAASLSKPVFTYLILKLIGSSDLKLNTKLNEVLPFEKFCEKCKIRWENSQENLDRIEQFTPAMILSHKTGLPISYNPASGPLKFDFEPSKGFGYTGLPLMYLQKCIELKFNLSLQELAKKYVFDPAGMSNSNFNKPTADEANAANSLFTTAEDYVRFCIHWMHDPDPLVQDAFMSKVSMLNDPWAVREEISSNTLNHLAWGFGWGLEKNDKGDVVSAYHTGDMGEWRAGVKLDLIEKSAKVFLSQSTFGNGHLLQDQIFGRSYALDFFFDKFKFARTPSELKNDWRENPSFGIRKESIKNIDKRISSTTNILSVVSSNPIEAAKHQLQTTLPTTPSLETETKERNNYQSPAPLSTTLTPNKNN